MKNIAVCYYGGPGDISKNIVPNNYDVVIFCDADCDLAASLYNVSLKKRIYEIENSFEFDACVAINTNVFIDIAKFVTPSHKTVYYHSGRYVDDNVSIIISFDMFYADSITFDRACEYKLNLENLKPLENIFNIDNTFYHHLKSLMLTTECINLENSSLFIRPA